jgi:hypothetical protein
MTVIKQSAEVVTSYVPLINRESHEACLGLENVYDRWVQFFKVGLRPLAKFFKNGSKG